MIPKDCPTTYQRPLRLWYVLYTIWYESYLDTSRYYIIHISEFLISLAEAIYKQALLAGKPKFLLLAVPPVGICA